MSSGDSKLNSEKGSYKLGQLTSSTTGGWVFATAGISSEICFGFFWQFSSQKIPQYAQRMTCTNHLVNIEAKAVIGL